MSSHRMISSQVSLTLRALAFHSSNQAKSIAVSWSVRKIPWTLASRKSFVRHAMAISRNYPMYICADPRFASLHCLICWKMRQSSRRCKQWSEKWKNRSRNSEVEVVVENRIRGSERNDAMGVTMIMLCWDCQTTLDWGSMGWWDWLENEAMRRRLISGFQLFCNPAVFDVLPRPLNILCFDYELREFHFLYHGKFHSRTMPVRGHATYAVPRFPATDLHCIFVVGGTVVPQMETIWKYYRWRHGQIRC